MANIAQAERAEEAEVDNGSWKVLQIQIPEDLHTQLKGEAAYARQAYKDYVIDTLWIGLEAKRKKGARRGS